MDSKALARQGICSYDATNGLMSRARSMPLPGEGFRDGYPYTTVQYPVLRMRISVVMVVIAIPNPYNYLMQFQSFRIVIFVIIDVIELCSFQCSQVGLVILGADFL